MLRWFRSLSREQLLLCAAIVFGVALRLSHVSDPYLADFHAWRQADTAGFAHGYLIDSLNPFDPSIDRYPCEHRDAPFGRVESEWPGIQWLSALPLVALGQAYPPPWYLRSVSILFFVLTSLYLAALVRRHDGNYATAILSVVAFSAFPLSIFFTRTVQPDGPALCLAVAFLFHLDRWLAPSTLESSRRTRQLDSFLAGLFAALALLVKISNAFLGIPALYVIARRRGLMSSIRNVWLWLWGLGVLLPVALWYRHARDFAWSFGIWGDRGASKFTDAAFAGDASVWKRLAEREVYEILTWGGLALLLVGVARIKRSPSARLGVVWLLAVVAFVLLTLRGNNRHIYYQLPIVLPAAILVGHGARTLLQRGPVGIGVLLMACTLHGAITYEVLWGTGDRLHVVPYFRSDAALIEGIELVRKHVPEGEVFVSADRHPALFYNSGRRGYFGNMNPNTLLACAGDTTPYLLLNRHARSEMVRMLKARPRLRGSLRELERGKRYSMWTYASPPPKTRR